MRRFTSSLRPPGIGRLLLSPSTPSEVNTHIRGSPVVFISTDGGGNWVPIKSTDLGRALPLEDNPRRVMLRIENIPRSPAGDYEYRLQAFPGSEAPPVSGASGLTATYGYDHAGNRVRETINGQAAVYEYHPHSDRLWKKGDITFSYDPNGNLVLKETPEGRWNYQYDYANRLVAVYKDGVLVKQYLYDHTGLRIGAVDAEGQTTIYLYDLHGNLIQEREGGEVRNYVWALGKHLARVDGTIGDPASRVYWYHTDHLGTVQVISDAQGQVVWRNDYRAFGEQLGPEVEEIENAHAFTGKDWDAEVGLYYFNARWYDPELGRFISEDPVGDPNNPNLYAYARNNPLIFFDPTGLTSLADLGLTPGTTGATWEELESIEIAEPGGYDSGGTAEEVPPSPGEAVGEARLNLEFGGFDPNKPDSAFSLDDSLSDLYSPPDRSKYFVLPELGVAFDPGTGSWYGYMEVSGDSYFSAVPLDPEDFWSRISAREPEWVYPLKEIIIRGRDKHGAGWYLAPRSGGKRQHTGVDLLAPIGTPVYAVHDGMARWSYDSISGWTISITFKDDSGNLVKISYCHLQSNSLGLTKIGQTIPVKAGQEIGSVGVSGNALNTRPHLHLTIRVNNSHVDPKEFLPLLDSSIAKETRMDYYVKLEDWAK